MASRAGTVIGILVFIIVVLAGFLFYAFALRPAITGYSVDKLNEGYFTAVLQIINQAETCQVVPLTLGNKTVNIVDVSCLQAPQQAPPQGQEQVPEQ